jgi:hypothetical protein
MTTWQDIGTADGSHADRPAFTQADYSAAVAALDVAFDVFQRTCGNPEAAFESFVCDHYLPVWRQMCPSPPSKEGE